MPACIDLMAEALSALARGDVALPLRTMLRLPGTPNILACMPSFLATRNVAGVKVITVFPGNHGTALDSHQGAVLLFDGDTGALLAIMDATAITTIRTAAVSALATRLLAREDADELAILGAGVQGTAHLAAIPHVRPIARVRIWSRNTERARALAMEAEELHGLHAVVEATPERAVRGASIICTTTSSTTPVLEGRWLSPGAHVNAVGACTPTARELDTEAVVRSRLFVDRRESALAEPAEIIAPMLEGAIDQDHIIAEIGEIAAGMKPGRGSDEEITLFESLGLAVEDLASADFLYHAAQSEQAGTWVELGGHRHAAR
jgi:ornithine cyclodeaminase/alanine dehydrogenase-like protein (mu-crystallin family)